MIEYIIEARSLEIQNNPKWMRIKIKKCLKCEYCSETSKDIGHDAIKWVCSKCVQKSMDGSLTIDFNSNTEDDKE